MRERETKKERGSKMEQEDPVRPLNKMIFALGL